MCWNVVVVVVTWHLMIIFDTPSDRLLEYKIKMIFKPKQYKKRYTITNLQVSNDVFSYHINHLLAPKVHWCQHPICIWNDSCIDGMDAYDGLM